MRDYSRRTSDGWFYIMWLMILIGFIAFSQEGIERNTCEHLLASASPQIASTSLPSASPIPTIPPNCAKYASPGPTR